MRAVRTVFLVGLALLLVSCAQDYTAETVKDPYGFFSGIWHGIVCLLSIATNILSWFLSLSELTFCPDVQIVGRPNTGFLFYYVGFWIGLSSWGGGGAAAGAQPEGDPTSPSEDR